MITKSPASHDVCHEIRALCNGLDKYGVTHRRRFRVFLEGGAPDFLEVCNGQNSIFFLEIEVSVILGYHAERQTSNNAGTLARLCVWIQHLKLKEIHTIPGEDAWKSLDHRVSDSGDWRQGICTCFNLHMAEVGKFYLTI